MREIYEIFVIYGIYEIDVNYFEIEIHYIYVICVFAIFCNSFRCIFKAMWVCASTSTNASASANANANASARASATANANASVSSNANVFRN